MARKKTTKVQLTDLSVPQTRTEEFLAKIAGLTDSLPSGEFSRLERYLKYIAEHGGGGISGVESFNSRTGAVTPQNGDYTAAMVGARADTWVPTAADVGAQADLGFVEDATYSGCLYRNVTVGGQTVREWVNPPLVADTEYRTTERFNGKPVYAKAYSVTDSSKLPSASNQVKNTNLSIPNLETIISVTASGVWHNTTSTLISHAVLPYRDILYAYSSYGSNGSQYIEVMSGTLPANVVIDSVFAVIKYTKSTD